MHGFSPYLLIAQAEEPGKAVQQIGEKMSQVGSEVQEQITRAENVEQLLEVLRGLAVDYLAPLALNVAAAIIIVLVGRWVARLVGRLADRMLERHRIEATLRGFLLSILQSLLLLLILILAMGQLGIDTTAFAAVLGAAGLAVGFALKDSLANFASGVMLVMFRPFAVGDFVEAAGVKGLVEEIHLFNTRLNTGDNVRIIVPNSAIMGKTITNFTANTTRRIDLEVQCGYDDDLRAVQAFLVQLLADDTRVLTEPEPTVAVNNLADNGVSLVVRPWVKREDYWATRCDLLAGIKTGFDEHGFTIPYPTREVFMHAAGADADS